MRTIKLKVLTQNELVVVETNARTFGEFKTEVSGLGIDWSSAKLIDKASKASFEVDNAILPATDALMFVMPVKSKAGASRSEMTAAVKALKEKGVEIPFNYTHATNKQLEDFLSSQTTEEEPAEVIFLKPGKYILVVEENETENAEEAVAKFKATLVEWVTFDDLQKEAEELKKKF